jgi:putative membrane protein
MGWGGGLFVFLVFIVVIVVIVVIAWLILTVASQRSHHHRPIQPQGPASAEPSSEALKILDERFARGEISPEEYTERRDLLKGSSSRTT